MPSDKKDKSGEHSFYIGVDGDSVGHLIEDALTDNDIEESQKWESKINAAFSDIKEYVASIGGHTLFGGGDNLLCSFNGDPKEVGEKLRGIYKDHTGHSASAGCGRKPVEAHKALTIAKNTGKDKLVLWDASKEKVYAEVKKQQTELEDCEKDIREDSEFDLQSSPALKYRAERHYERLLSAGYEPTKARDFVNDLYKQGESWRDVLLKRKERVTSFRQFLKDGEEGYRLFLGSLEEEKENPEPPVKPVVAQKFVTRNDIGMVNFVGSRFVTVEYLKQGKKERVALSNFQRGVKDGSIVLIPKIRTITAMRVSSKDLL